LRQPERQIKFIYYNPFSDLSTVEKYWQLLLRKCEHEYFLSWGWISTWIKSLEARADIRLVVGFIQNEPVAGFFIGTSSKRKYGIFRSKLVSLNTTGSAYFDKLFLEYNRILVDAAVQFGVRELIQALADIPWDEFNLPGLGSDFVGKIGLIDLPDTARFHILIDELSPASFVDLEQVRAMDLDYMRLVSSNKRSQIRRSIKEYEKDGEVRIIEAASANQALGYLAELIALHQKEWSSRGEVGAFSNRYLSQFHADLIAARFEHGEIQILKCFTPKATIGVLYNFIYNGRVYFYQSGFDYPPGNVYRPGLVSHYFAIRHNAEKGMSVYDFMAGDASYKTSLAPESQPMYWIRLFRRPFQFHLERTVRQVNRWIKSMPGAADGLRRLKDVSRRAKTP
jgi:hypothetical protein